MSGLDTGRLLGGDAEVLRRSVAELEALAVDQELQWGEASGFAANQYFSAWSWIPYAGTNLLGPPSFVGRKVR